MIDKLALFNVVVKVVRPASGDEVVARTLQDTFPEIGIDSMDVIMVAIYFSDIYGVDEETAKNLLPQNPQQFFDMFEAVATKHPQTIDEALKNIIE